MKKLSVVLSIIALVGCTKTEYSTEETTTPVATTNRYDTNQPGTVRTTPAPGETDSTTVRPQDRERLEQRLESDLAQQVQAALRADEAFSALISDIQVSASTDGVVTLRGSVRSENQKTEIANKVSAMPGVKRVDNQLTVKPEGDNK